MSTSPKVLLGEDGILSNRNTSSFDANLPNDGEQHLEHEEEDEEEEDIDFNPFLKDSPSIEASSSLSSELDAWGGDVADSRGETSVAKMTDFSSLPPGQLQDDALGDSEHGEGIVVQTTISSGQIGEKESADASSTRYMKRKAGNEPETEKDGEQHVSSNNTVMNGVMVGDVGNSGNAIILGEDEDAICKRTRARYSLASFTLDELETFLQETDDDDDIQNVDDEEEYRKFLAAVLLDGANDDQIIHGVENVEDEDEDNDADFEIEIEEALESDPDESIKGNSKVDKEVGNRRPETRLNRRQKASSRQKNKLSSQTNRPLRPILPNAPKASFPVPMPETARVPGHEGFVNGFAQHQLAQLHSIIHEHVQLLVQVFSLCIVDPSKQHIASQVQEMISQLLCQRDQSISWKVAPYPYCGASSPYIHPSAQRRLNEQGMQPDQTSSSLENRGLDSNGHDGGLQASNRASGVPSGTGPILSVLDVAPLKLVGKYMEDVSIAHREYQRQRLQASCETSSKKEPLFPFHRSSSEADFAISKGTLVGDQSQKKTWAATLVEKSKQQSVALVPEGIAELAQRFFPLFNPALFPRKPPPAAVAKRVLFTDAEDELLAMGLMEYNTDWKAIQQRFLPCKSEHQIFVRQKNRSSSKAPENPIKAVRRMKNSPLTAEEIGRIQEALKVYKLDWMTIWKLIVPYRDPTLLARQWRIATGTQKSYKGTEDKKEKRRLYEQKRRKCRASDPPSWQTLSEREEGHTDTVGENNSGDDGVDSEDEAYVHEAFLADWRPGDLMARGGSRIMDQANSSASLVSQQRTNYELPVAFKHFQNLGTSSQSTQTLNGERNPVHDQALTGPKYPLSSRSRRSRKGKNAQLVKLAPDLPPVNLPPSVRVMSQSAFKSYQGSTPTKPDGDVRGSAKEPTVSSLPPGGDKSNADQHRQESPPGGDKSFTGDKEDSRDLHMHPLLFQSSGDGHLPYYPLNCGNSASSSLNFLPQIQPQLNLSLLHNPQTTNHPFHWFQRSSQETTSTPGSIDFHPLLQKSGEVNCDSTTGQPASHLAINKSVLQPLVTVQSESQPDNHLLGPRSTSVCPNELDLNIRLSFTDAGGESSPSLSVPPDRIGNKFDSSSKAPVVSTNNIVMSGVSIEDDQSFPDIVMEQEELSDSEEEFGEDVQFECEEMDDSEADEGSDAELQIMDKQNKDVPNAERSKATSDADVEDAQAQTKGRLPDGPGHAAECSTSRLSLASEEKAKEEDTINTSSLHTSRLEQTDRDHAVTGTSISSSSKSCKKQPPRRKRATPKQQDNGPEPGPGAAKPPRRTRKSAGNSSVNTGRTRKRNSSVNTGTTVENPNDVSNSGVS